MKQDEIIEAAAGAGVGLVLDIELVGEVQKDYSLVVLIGHLLRQAEIESIVAFDSGVVIGGLHLMKVGPLRRSHHLGSLDFRIQIDEFNGV